MVKGSGSNTEAKLISPGTLPIPDCRTPPDQLIHTYLTKFFQVYTVISSQFNLFVNFFTWTIVHVVIVLDYRCVCSCFKLGRILLCLVTQKRRLFWLSTKQTYFRAFCATVQFLLDSLEICTFGCFVHPILSMKLLCLVYF